VVVRLAVGAPEGALASLVLPIAPDPPTPDLSVPVRVTTVMEAAALCERLAFTLTLDRAEVANARHISAVPSCKLARCTNAQVSPAPLTPVTAMPEEFASVEMNASKSSLPVAVEKVGEVILTLALERSVDFT
jgi:hypothetical protein